MPPTGGVGDENPENYFLLDTLPNQAAGQFYCLKLGLRSLPLLEFLDG
jgi:hypothetical protein